MQVLQRQLQILRKSAVMRDDSQHRSSRAVCLESPPAEFALWLESVSRARNVDLPANTPSRDRKSTRLNSSHDQISYAVFCLKKKKKKKKKTHNKIIIKNITIKQLTH